MTGFNSPYDRPVYGASDARILELWRAGLDTLEIARILQRSESSIANRLPHLLGVARREAEWDFDRIKQARAR